MNYIEYQADDFRRCDPGFFVERWDGAVKRPQTSGLIPSVFSRHLDMNPSAPRVPAMQTASVRPVANAAIIISPIPGWK